MKTTLTYKFCRYIVKNKIRSVRDIIWYIRNVHLQKRRNSCLKRVPTEEKKRVETIRYSNVVSYVGAVNIQIMQSNILLIWSKPPKYKTKF